MSLTSYQTAPPRVVIMAMEVTKAIRNGFRRIDFHVEMAPAVGFEPTTNRLTADRSTTELLWIAGASIFVYRFA